MRAVVGLVVGLAFAAAIVLLTEAPMAMSAEDAALVRLSWRLRADEGEDCRRPTPEELAELPVHMRDPNACVGGVHRSYELLVTVDGVETIRDTIRPSGSRGDRPIFVFRELLVDAGRRDISVVFQRLAGADAVSQGTSPSGTDLRWADSVVLAPREIFALSYDPELDRLTPLAQGSEPAGN